MASIDTPTLPPLPARTEHVRVAPLWHTIVLLVLVLAVSAISAVGAQQAATRGSNRMLQYGTTIAWLWLLTGYVYLGVRKTRAISFGELVGKKWKSFEDFLLDMAIAAGFWMVAVAVLVGLAYAFGLATAEQQTKARDMLAFLAPRNVMEFAAWIAVSVTAGVCEEIVFRGYLQRQFAALTSSAAAGIVLSAIFFGVGHGYQGWERMIIIGVYGAMFGVLAQWRRNLRPGMIAHAWHDIFQGAMLSLMRKMNA